MTGAALLLQDLARRLHLRQRLIAVDVETTGIDPQADRIVQIAGYVVQPRDPDAGVYDITPIGPHLVNPERPIPSEAAAVHGITDADVHGAPTWRELAAVLAPACVGEPIALVAFNGRFDARFIAAEFARVSMVDAAEAIATAPILDPYRIYQQKCPRTLTAAVQHYCGRELGDEAHDALADITATVEVLVQQLDLYDDLPTSVAALDDYCAQRDPSWIDREGKFVWRDGEAVCMVGKWRGTPLRKVEKSYLAWMAGPRCDFAADAKAIAERAALGQYPARETAVAS